MNTYTYYIKLANFTGSRKCSKLTIIISEIEKRKNKL